MACLFTIESGGRRHMKKIDDSVSGHLSEIAIQLSESIKLVSDNPEASIDYKLWEIFADLELNVALLKLEIRKENPAIEIARPKSPLSLEESLISCAALVTSSLSRLSRGHTNQAIEQVRDARNIMRELLVRIRRR